MNPIATQNDIADLIGDVAFGGDTLLVRDKADFGADFRHLQSGLLGDLAQKLVNDRPEMTLTGDFSDEIGRSRALGDFFREGAARGPIRLTGGPQRDGPESGGR